MTSEAETITPWTSYPHYGMSAYRIWNRDGAHGLFQRHEWRRAHGSTHLEDWIPTRVRAHGAVAA